MVVALLDTTVALVTPNLTEVGLLKLVPVIVMFCVALAQALLGENDEIVGASSGLRTIRIPPFRSEALSVAAPFPVAPATGFKAHAAPTDELPAL
jgi:hypothetical protein